MRWWQPPHSGSLKCVTISCRWESWCAAGTAVADELMDDVHVKESHASSSVDPAVEPPDEVASTPAPVLKTWSSIKEFAFPVARTGIHFGRRSDRSQERG